MSMSDALHHPPASVSEDHAALKPEAAETPSKPYEPEPCQPESPATNSTASPQQTRSAESDANAYNVEQTREQDEVLNVGYVQRLLAAGDVAGAEQALKQLKKSIKGERKQQKEKSSKKEKRSCEDAATVVSADEHKGRRSIEKEHKRESEIIDKNSKESYKAQTELESRRTRDERKDRDRIEKDRRDLERAEAEARRDVVKAERHERDHAERERKQIEKNERESRRDAERIAKEIKLQELRRPKVPPTRSLISFGFSAEKRKLHECDNNLFTPFVPDKRIVPSRLQFWAERSDQTVRSLEVAEDTPPEMTVSSKMVTRCAVPEGFCTEVIFTGFSAIGFEPALARPSYWGTSNPNLNENELECLVRYPLHAPIPRLSTLDYDCDSGDEWDHADSDDDDVDASDDEEDESDYSDSCTSFIDDNSCTDSDGEEVSRFINARARRQHRLRGKDRLIPICSGPYTVNMQTVHPLRSMEELTIFVQVDQSAVRTLLIDELEKTTSADILPAATSTVQRYRAMGDHEIEEMKLLVQENPLMSKSLVCDTLVKRPSFAGVPSTEIRRTMKRFFEHAKGTLVEREEPWGVGDPRLIEKKGTRKRDRPKEGSGIVSGITINSPAPSIDADAT